jgi:hypothetical protein
VEAGARTRLPLQGGLPPPDAVTGSAAQIACDESGYSGTNLLDTSSPVMAHASVDLSDSEAAELIAVLRSRSRFSLSELKSGQFLRGRDKDSLEWFLSALTGRAHVHLVDKEYFLVSRIVDLFLAEPSYAAGTRLTQEQRPAARSLYRAGRADGGRDWEAFLAAFVGLVRTKHRRRPDRVLLKHFFQARDSLAAVGLGPMAADVLDGLEPERVRAVVARLTHDDRSIPPPLEPMLPAVAETVLFWSGQRRVLVVHDEQSALTADRLRRLQRALAEGAPVSPLAGLVTVDSRDDPRVQVADLLAGIARRFADTGEGSLPEAFWSSTSLRDPGG